MPTSSPTSPATTTLRVTLPDAVYQEYLQQAETAGQDLEQLLGARLEASVTYRADKPLYFSDADRQELERLLGRNVLHTTDALIHIRNTVSVRIGPVRITLKPALLQRLKTRCIRQDWDKFLEERILQALEAYVGLR